MILEEIEIIHGTEEDKQMNKNFEKPQRQLGKHVTVVNKKRDAMKKNQSETKKELFKIKMFVKIIIIMIGLDDQV